MDEVIDRLCTALCLDEERVLAMRFQRARSLFAYWERHPPACESNEMLLRVQTTWKPAPKSGEAFRESTPQELAAFASESGFPILPRPK